MLTQLAMIIACAACAPAQPITTKPAVYYVPEPVYHYERRSVSPSAVKKLEELQKNLNDLDSLLKRPAEQVESAPPP
jgi:hypothetical protein